MQAEALYVYPTDSVKSLLEAEKLARRATEIEPGYAVSWALLGFTISSADSLGVERRSGQRLQEASLALVNKALSLAPE